MGLSDGTVYGKGVGLRESVDDKKHPPFAFE